MTLRHVLYIALRMAWQIQRIFHHSSIHSITEEKRVPKECSNNGVGQSVYPASSYHQAIWIHKFMQHALICNTSLSCPTPFLVVCLDPFVRFKAFDLGLRSPSNDPKLQPPSNSIAFPWNSCPTVRNPSHWTGSPTQILRQKILWQILDLSKEWSLVVFLGLLECGLRKVIRIWSDDILSVKVKKEFKEKDQHRRIECDLPTTKGGLNEMVSIDKHEITLPTNQKWR